MEKKLLYRFDNFSPSLRAGGSIRYDFSVFLDKGFAIKAQDFELDPKLRNRLQELGRETIFNKLFKGETYRDPYYFNKDSLLIQGIFVPGTGCHLAIDGFEIDYIKKSTDNVVTYAPHNIDTIYQAYSLASLFSMWVNYAESILKSK
jgi:hypothetical protein